MIRRNLEGRTFGRLTAKTPTDKRGNTGDVVWLCECSCGNTKLVSSKLLLSKSTKSCGCLGVYTIDPLREVKRCSRCKETISIDKFPKNKTSKDGHSQYCKICTSTINKEGKVKYKSRINRYSNYKYHNNLEHHITHSLRNRMRLAIRNNQKFGKTLDFLGCSVEELKSHLECGFHSGMSWDNYGQYWQIDHIKPCALFDMSQEAEQKRCFNYTNLQPMLSKDNARKGKIYNG